MPVGSLVRATFFLYALVLFIGTHWPALKINAPGRPDLLVHAAIFSLWTLLLIACGFFGPVLSRRNILTALPVAIVYAAIDESLQAIPWIRRTAALDDYLMNVTGIVAAAALAGTFLILRRNAPPAKSTIEPVSTRENPAAR
jgi:hypothetical protein